MANPGQTSTRRSTTVVLPVPDGAEMTMSRPRAGLLDILHLLAEPLEFRLGRDDGLRRAQAVDLGSDGVDFAVHFLQQKIQLPAARLRPLGQRLPVLEM